MSWDPCTVFSVITGIVCIGYAALAQDVKAKDRLGWVLGGLFFLGYGTFVATRTSGTWTFSVCIFILPVLLIGRLVLTRVTRRGTGR